MDIFSKCFTYSYANELRAQGLYPYFHALETRQGPEVVMEGKRRIMLGFQQLPRPDFLPGGDGGGTKGARTVRHGLFRLALSQRHAEAASETGGGTGRLFAQGSLLHVLHGLPVQPRHPLGAGGPWRLCALRQGKPRQHLRRLPPFLRAHAHLWPQQHGGIGNTACEGARERRLPHRH